MLPSAHLRAGRPDFVWKSAIDSTTGAAEEAAAENAELPRDATHYPAQHWFRTSNPRQDSGPEAGPSSPRDILRKTGGGWNEQTTGSLSRKTGAGGGSSNQPGAADLC